MKFRLSTTSPPLIIRLIVRIIDGSFHHRPICAPSPQSSSPAAVTLPFQLIGGDGGYIKLWSVHILLSDLPLYSANYPFLVTRKLQYMASCCRFSINKFPTTFILQSRPVGIAHSRRRGSCKIVDRND